MEQYEGYYLSFDSYIKSKSLSGLKKKIEKAMGDKFKDYETAWINEYNLIGRRTACYYFSLRDKRWHKSSNRITSYMSWGSAISPFKQIAQWLLIGNRIKEEEMTEAYLRKRKIDELYGK